MMEKMEALRQFADMSIGESATIYLDGDIFTIDETATDHISSELLEWDDENGGIQYPEGIFEHTNLFHVSEYWDCVSHVERGLPLTIAAILEGTRVVMEYAGVYAYDSEFDDYDAVGWVVMSRIIEEGKKDV